jgi:hypothetical protein
MLSTFETCSFSPSASSLCDRKAQRNMKRKHAATQSVISYGANSAQIQVALHFGRKLEHVEACQPLPHFGRKVVGIHKLVELFYGFVEPLLAVGLFGQKMRQPPGAPCEKRASFCLV